MNGSRPAPSGNRPAPDATNVSPIVEPGSLFEITSDAYGGTRVVMPESSGVKDVTPEPVKVAHQRMANTIGADLWLKMAELWIDQRLEAGRTVTADGMQSQVGTPPTAGLPAVAIKRAKLAGKIVRVGFAPSERPEARGHVCAIWERR